MTIDEKFEHLSNWLQIRTDIICNNPDKWLRDYKKNYLPSFEYYLKNCVEDKGGDYDFTVRRYRTYSERIYPIESEFKPQLKLSQKIINIEVEYSYWMGTPFNYKQKIILL